MSKERSRPDSIGPTCSVEPDVDLGQPAFARSGIDIYVCPSCGSFQAGVGFDTAQYDSDYYTIASDDPAEIEWRWGFRWRYVLDGIVELGHSDGSILDVGAGNGSFVKIAREEFGFEATGIEPSEASTRFARDVLHVDLLNCNLADHVGTYDIVAAFSVIEHLEDPVAMVDQLVARLAPGGLLVLATPNPGCIQRRVGGRRRWAMLCPPHHLNVLTTKGVDMMLSRSGVEVVRREAISTQVKVVRSFDTHGQVLRRAVFRALRATGLGADQLVFARRSAPLSTR